MRSALFAFLITCPVWAGAQAVSTATAPVDPYEDAVRRVKLDDAMQRRKALEDLGRLRRREAGPLVWAWPSLYTQATSLPTSCSTRR
jgi:hypothetical protein